MSAMVRFFVPGLPRPGGSKKGFYIPKIKRVVITEDNKRSKDWRATVALVASETVKTPMEGPLFVYFDFRLPRPKGHMGKSGVRASAPAYPAVKPDTTKFIRSTEDAMTGIVWHDDAQIVAQAGSKQYDNDKIGAWITVCAMGYPIMQALAKATDEPTLLLDHS